MKPQKQALQSIYAFLLGLMFVIFVGVGMNTFYTYPQVDYNSYSSGKCSNKDYSDEEMTECYEKESGQRETEAKEMSDRQSSWSTTSSIILIVIATVTLVIALLFNSSLEIISNGLLLGAFFTLIYGTGLSFFGGDKIIRFVIVTISLGITIAVGYLKFIKNKNDNNLNSVDQSPLPPSQDNSGNNQMG